MNSIKPAASRLASRRPSAVSNTFFALMGVCLAILNTGCWAPPIKPDTSALLGIKSILIVPVASPPLEVFPDLAEQSDPAYRAIKNMQLEFPVHSGIYQTPGGITVAGNIIADSMTETRTSNTGGHHASAWSPTSVASTQALNLLAAETYRGVVSPEFYRLPLPDTLSSSGLQAWWDATRAWYALERTSTDYRLAGRFDAVLELGISGYRVFEDQVSLQLLLKLIDPVSQRVIARTSGERFVVDDSAARSLKGDGEKFKQRIAQLSVPLLRQSLRDIGLYTASLSKD